MAEEAKKLGDALLRFTADTEEATTLIVRGVGQYVNAETTARSPVGQPGIWKANEGLPRDKWKRPAGYVGGRFKGGWQATIGKPAEGEVARIDPSGAVTAAANEAVLATAVAPREVWFTNNVPYAEVLEAGHSKQAPAGIVAVLMAGIGAAFEQEAKEALAQKGLA
jgi:hypothetical protein